MLHALLLLVLLAIPTGAQATTFYDSDFESGSSFLANGWDDDGTAAPGTLEITTEQAITGTQSAKGTFDNIDGSSSQPFIIHAFPESTHIFTRFGYRVSLGFQIGSNNFTKIMRFRGVNGYPIIWLELHGGAYSVTVEGPYDFNDVYILDSGVAPSSTSWDQVEFEIQLNTPGSSNGAIRMWVNGDLRVEQTGKAYIGPTNSSIGQSGQLNPANLTFNDQTIYIQSGLGVVYFDRVAVGDTRIGLIGGSPPADTTPPSAPSTPTLSVSGGGQINSSWTNGTDANGVVGTNILRCTGAACSPINILTVVNNGTTVSYADTGLVAGTTYGYRLSNFDAAGNQSAFSAVAYATTEATFRTQTISDFFNRADSTELGASWDAGYTSFFGATTNLAIVNNQLRVATLAADSLETNNTAVANDQWAQITFISLTAADANIKAPGIMLRANAPGDLTGYGFRVWVYNGSPHTRIERWDALVAHVVLADESATTWLTGDKLRGEAEGPTLRLYQVRGATETLILSATDATYGSGRTGIIHFVQAGTTADIQIDDFTAGEFVASAPTPPAMTFCTGGSRVSTTCTYTGTPATIRVATEFGSVVEPLSSFPSGVYTFPPEVLATMTDFFCMYPRDTLGVENTAGGHCNTVPYTPDTSPPVLSNPLPTATLPNGTTSTAISVTVDKPVACRYDTTDIAYGSMQTTSVMGRAGLTVSGTVTGLVTGANLFYVRCNFIDVFDVEHPNLTSTVITVTVAASTADTTVPSTVTNLVANVLSNSQVELAWTVATDNVAIDGYNVYLSVGAGNTTYLLEAQTSTATRIVVSLTPNTVHNFVVKARDTSQNLSAANSNVVTVTTEVIPDVTPPSTVTNVRVIGVYKNSIWLGWDQPTDDRGAPTVTIEYCEGAACSTFAVLVSRYALDHLVVTLTPSTSYSFRILAVDQASNAAVAYSNVVTAVTAATGLERPRKPLTAARLPRN